MNASPRLIHHQRASAPLVSSRYHLSWTAVFFSHAEYYNAELLVLRHVWLSDRPALMETPGSGGLLRGALVWSAEPEAAPSRLDGL